MSFVRLARAAGLACAAVLSVLPGCTSDPATKAPTDFCGVAKASGKTCKEPSSCDDALTASCRELDKVVSEATITAARDCLESGVCGPASCLSRAQKGAAPTSAHATLAANFCTFCAPNVADCEAQFYKSTSKLPGPLVLPYAPDVVKAIDDACTGVEGCQANFARCATQTIEEVVGAALDPELADCVISGFRRDDEGRTGPGGGAQVATCTPENCNGCCREDRCEDGTTESACGAGGAGCEVCGGTQACSGGKCKEPCGPNNCPGCCDGDLCVPGTAKDKCGGDGEACTSCTGSFICSNKTCIDGSCQATCTSGCCTAAGCQPGNTASACGIGGEACVDCGPGRTCQAGACALDRASLWDVYVSFAVVPEKDSSGASWDPLSGKPDCYGFVYTSEGASTHSGFTTTQMDTTVPFWAETPVKGVKASELLNYTSVDVWDEDADFDDYIGGCKLPLTASIFDGSLQSHVCPAGASTSEVKVYYRINPHKP